MIDPTTTCLTDPAIVTVAHYTMCPDGLVYLYLWCADWRVVIDRDLMEGFRSSERWQLHAIVGGEFVVALPGCQVKAVVRSKTPPPEVPGNANCFAFGVRS